MADFDLPPDEFRRRLEKWKVDQEARSRESFENGPGGTGRSPFHAGTVLLAAAGYGLATAAVAVIGGLLLPPTRSAALSGGALKAGDLFGLVAIGNAVIGVGWTLAYWTGRVSGYGFPPSPLPVLLPLLPVLVLLILGNYFQLPVNVPVHGVVFAPFLLLPVVGLWRRLPYPFESIRTSGGFGTTRPFREHVTSTRAVGRWGQAWWSVQLTATLIWYGGSLLFLLHQRS